MDSLATMLEWVETEKAALRQKESEADDRPLLHRPRYEREPSDSRRDRIDQLFEQLLASH
jgi:hypothetical protein